MISKEVCLFTKYVGDAVDNPDSKTYFSYGNLLRRCTCDNCMKEKEANRKYQLKK